MENYTAMIPLKQGHESTEQEEIDKINRMSADNAWRKLERKYRRAAAKAERRETNYNRYRQQLTVRCIVDCAAAAALYALDAMAGWAALICCVLSVINACWQAKVNG